MNQFEETKLLETKSPVAEDMKDIVVEPSKESIKEETKPTKIPKQKCYHCKVKLKMIVFTCKCNHIFCQRHLGAHSHNCPYDYKNEKKKQIEENNPKLESRMERI
jgi:hypothetical protein